MVFPIRSVIDYEFHDWLCISFNNSTNGAGGDEEEEESHTHN
jgi:hypothetical protein